MKAQRSSQSKQIELILPAILFLSVIVSGIFLCQFLERVGLGNLEEQSDNVMDAMAMGIQNELLSSQATVGALAGSPGILPALLEPDQPENIHKANIVLDRYNKHFGFSVCYLLDLQGRAIASSNRNVPESFVGKHYAFRPYFQEAVRGIPSVYMATGVTSHERGFYAGYPVNDERGKVVGVAAIKVTVEAAEGILKGYKNSFYISPDGIVFMSGSQAMSLKPLWPLDQAQLRAIQDSNQFDVRSWEPLLTQSVRNGDKISLGEAPYQCFRKPLGPKGWSLVLLAPLKTVFYYIFFGVVVTVFMGGLVILLTVWAFFRMRAQESFRESEERFHAAFESSGIGMALVLPDGRWLQVNPSLCRIVGYTAVELLKMTFQDITHPEDLDTDLTYVRRLLAGEIHGYDMEKRYFRKDGHVVWVHLSVSLVRGTQGEPLYFVSQIQDITESKSVGGKLQEKIKELERFNKLAVGRELKMIELKAKLETLERDKEGV